MNWSTKKTDREKQALQDLKIECLIITIFTAILTGLCIFGAIWSSIHPQLNYWGKPMEGDPTVMVAVLGAILMGLATLLSLADLIRVWKAANAHTENEVGE